MTPINSVFSGIRNSKALCASIAVAGALGAASTSASAFDWYDNSLSYMYGSKFRESYIPFNRNLPDVNIKKNIFNFTHVSGDKLGGNLISIDYLKSDSNDPADASSKGATDYYIVAQRTFSMSAMTGTPWKLGFIKDVSIMAGIDLSSKNTTFGAKTWRPKIGPQIALDVPNGFWNMSLVYQREDNRCGTCTFAGQTTYPDFGSYGGFETGWGVGIGSLPLKFSGVLTYYAKKGNNGDTSPTGPETFLQTKLLYDVGSHFTKKNTVLVGLGYRYWKNQFGNTVTPTGYPFGGAGLPVPGNKTSVPMFVLEWHL